MPEHCAAQSATLYAVFVVRFCVYMWDDNLNPSVVVQLPFPMDL